MKNRMGFAVLLGFLVGYPFELSAQTISPEGEEQDDKVKKWFENLTPEDLGKYKM